MLKTIGAKYTWPLEFIVTDKKIPFANFVKSFGRINEYDDELKIDQSSNFEGIYINDSKEKEVGLYALETIPKVGTLF